MSVMVPGPCGQQSPAQGLQPSLEEYKLFALWNTSCCILEVALSAPEA